MGLREELKVALQAVVPDGVTVYGAGEDVLAVPAVVINPGDPMMTPTTMGKQARPQVALDLVLITMRAEPADALNWLEDMRFLLAPAIKTHNPAGRWVTFGQFGATTVAGAEYATAVISCLFVDSIDRGATIP
jgi:hypothetical protein